MARDTVIPWHGLGLWLPFLAEEALRDMTPGDTTCPCHTAPLQSYTTWSIDKSATI
jgi:hypothetical protein